MERDINRNVALMTPEQKRGNVQAVFDITAEKYVEYFGDEWEFLEQINDFIKQVNPGGKVLDIGCGSGFISNYMKNNGLNPLGIDFCSKMIEIANKRFPHIPFRKLDVSDVSRVFEEDTFDGLIAVYLLYFIPKEEISNVLQALSQISKPGAPLLVVTQIGKGETFVDETLLPEGQQKKALFTNLMPQQELIDLLHSNNFDVKKMEFFPNTDPDEISGDGRVVLCATNVKSKLKSRK